MGELGQPPTFHDLRHTFTTRLVATGVDARTAAAILGHSTPTTTLRVYASVDQGSLRGAMDGVAEVLGGETSAAAAVDDELAAEVVELVGRLRAAGMDV